MLSFENYDAADSRKRENYIFRTMEIRFIKMAYWQYIKV
jgi:hypothetical protein